MDITDIYDYTGETDPTQLIPHMGTSYKDNASFTDIVELLEKWQYKRALDKLESLIQNGRDSVDAYLLKGEILAHFDLNEEAANAFRNALKLDRENIPAIMMLLIQLTILKRKKEVSHYGKYLKEQSKELYEKYLWLIDFIHEHKNHSDFPECAIPVDVICVYGYTLNDDGSLPQILENRLLTAKRLADQYPSAKLLLSGGAVKNKYNEAVEMKKVLMEWRVNEDRLVTLEHAKDTVGNVIEFAGYITHTDIHHICVVTSKAHLPRAWMTLTLALKNGNYQTTISGASPKEKISKQMMKGEYLLNYQTVFRIAGLFEKNDILNQLQT